MAVRDLRVYADALDGKIYHYRDKNGLECDAVVHLRNGKYGLVEVKLGGDNLIESGAKTLKALAAKIDTEKMNAPSFMMVLTGVGTYAYTRTEGMTVVPISALSVNNPEMQKKRIVTTMTCITILFCWNFSRGIFGEKRIWKSRQVGYGFTKSSLVKMTRVESVFSGRNIRPDDIYSSKSL